MVTSVLSFSFPFDPVLSHSELLGLIFWEVFAFWVSFSLHPLARFQAFLYNSSFEKLLEDRLCPV